MTRCLIGAVSAIALMASAGITLAQSPKGGQESGSPSGSAPSASPPSAKSEAPGQTKSESGSARSEAPGQTKDPGSSAANEAPGRSKTQGERGDKEGTNSKSKSSQRDDATEGKRSKNAEGNGSEKRSKSADRNERENNSKSADERGKDGAPAGARQGDSPKQAGRDGAKSGASAHIDLKPEQKTKVVTTFRQHRVEPARDININVSVGTAVPRKVHLHAIPQDIVVIVPEFRSYKYFVYEDQVIIVEPATYEIVEVLILA